MMIPPFDHNGPPALDSASDLPSGMPKMHYFKCDIAAARKAIFDKPLDVRGAFFSAMLALYEHMEPLPADDGMAQMRLGIKHISTYRRVKAIMIDLGMLYQLPSGRLSSQRFEDEISAYVTEFLNRQRAAKEREKKARVARDTRDNRGRIDLESRSNRGRFEVDSTGDASSIDLRYSVDISRKPNKNNDSNTTVVAQQTPQADHEAVLRARVLELELEEEERKNPPPYSPTPELREGETKVGVGVYVNCETVRHRAFTLSIPAIAMQLAMANIGLSFTESTEVARDAAVAHALQWAAEIDNGKLTRDVVPSNPANFIRGSVARQYTMGQRRPSNRAPTEAIDAWAEARRITGGEDG